MCLNYYTPLGQQDEIVTENPRVIDVVIVLVIVKEIKHRKYIN